MLIKIMSRKSIMNLISKNKFPDNTVVLSFYGTYQEKVNFPSNIKHLCLCIDDLSPVWEVEDPDNFHNEDFKKAAKFVLKYYKLGYNIISQCEAGYSRSAGAAMAITEYFNHDGLKIFSDYIYSPNKMFFNQLYKYLKKEDHKNKDSK